MLYQAHRGVSSEAPENTIAAIELAVSQGYQVIECDVDVTKDGKLVLLHDHSIGRTARTTDGNCVENAPDVSDITYEEMLTYDFGLWFAPEFKGERAPLLVEILDIARKNRVKLKIDNKYRFFSHEMKLELYSLLADYSDIAELTCYTLDDLREAMAYMPKNEFHYDGLVNDEALEELAGLISPDRVTIWIPIKNRLTTWVKVAFADEALAEKIKKYGRLGVWIISSYEDAAFAESLGAYVVETNGLIKPRAPFVK